MGRLTFTRVILKRVTADWKLLLTVFAGVVLSTTIGAGTPIYLDSLEQLAFNASVDRLDASSVNITNVEILATSKSITEAEDAINDAIQHHIASVYGGHERFLRTSSGILGTDAIPIPEGAGTGVYVKRGYVQYLSGLESRIWFTQGRGATSQVSRNNLDGVVIEAVVHRSMAERYELGIDDLVEMGTELNSANAALPGSEDYMDIDEEESRDTTFDAPPIVTARIVGIFEVNEPKGVPWNLESALLDPKPLVSQPPFLTVDVSGHIPLALFTDREVLATWLQVEVDTFLGQDAYVRSAPVIVWTPRNPSPSSTGAGLLLRAGYLVHLTSIDDHVTVREGSLASNTVTVSVRGAEMEVMLVGNLDKRLQVELGDVVSFSPAVGQDKALNARIVGLVDEDDKKSLYWRNASPIIAWDSEDENPPFMVVFDKDLSAAQLVVTEEALTRALSIYPGITVSAQWDIQIDKERIKDWTPSEARDNFKAFSQAIIDRLPDAKANTSFVTSLSTEGAKRSFFSRIPMLLLLTVMVTVVLCFVAILVSYLTQSREDDSSIFKTLGAGLHQLFRIFFVEAAIMVGIAVLIAPFLAFAMVVISGVFPFFDQMNAGNTLPARLTWTPFLVSTAIGLICIVIVVVPNVLSARGGVFLRRLLTSRPTNLPVFQRLNLDVALLLIGGLTFWELQSRGRFVSGGLFTELQVNEVLLVAPVLFMVVVALIFMRLFPLIVQYVSGESPKLVHVLAVIGCLGFALGVGWMEWGQSVFNWVIPGSLCIALGVVYWYTSSVSQRRWFISLMAQAILIILLLLQPNLSEDVLVLPAIMLILLVPAQILFAVLQKANRISPIWLSMALAHMARNTMQYTWLILLLVLATGLSILATTLGGTLERSQTERILYEDAADLRISLTPMYMGGGNGLRELALTKPEVIDTALSFRGDGKVGPFSSEILAVEPDKIADVAWFRDDFSEVSLNELMQAIGPSPERGKIALPEGTHSIGLWIKPKPFKPSFEVLAQVENQQGNLDTVFFNILRSDDWHYLQGEIDEDFDGPHKINSIQLFEAGTDVAAGLGGLPATPGIFYIDDITAIVGYDNKEVVIEDFEDETMMWEPVITTAAASETVSHTTLDPYNGTQSAMFSFGGQAVQGIRAMFPVGQPGPVPAILSTSVVGSGREVGDTFVANIRDMWIPVIVKGTADLFPTMDPENGFMIMELNGLLDRANVILEFRRFRPEELLLDLSIDDDDVKEFRNSMKEDIGNQGGAVSDGITRLQELRLDPFSAAGWQPLMYLAPILAVIAAVVGYVTYLLLFAKRSSVEMGALRTMGLSKNQLLRLLAFEHLAIAAVGIGVGTWTGFQMSRLAVSPLAITEVGSPVNPPFILVTNWLVMAPTFVALITVFGAAVYLLHRGIGELDLRVVSRFGE